mmetsp:Transcript_92632/g.276251  ORF Transcript_92632/g.276251 Transcript_92632/m.276251 type:complete len:355 (+) Transcript_92632:64-1128(+)
MCQGVWHGAKLDFPTFGGSCGSYDSAAPITREEQDLQLELDRLRTEYQELEAAAAEQDAGDGVALHDACLERLRLTKLLQRYRERAPTVEELAERYESELDELVAEALRLREENSLLVARGMQCGPEEEPAAAAAVPPGAPPPPPRVRSAVEELHDEARRLRQKHAEYRQRERRARVEEWRLAMCQEEVRRLARQLRVQERRLEESRSQQAEAEACLHEIQGELARYQREVEQEQALIQRLNREAVTLREACYLPARVKRESGFLVKLLDRGGGRMKARRHLKGLEACKRLYDEVNTHAPAALPLAGRAKADMEAEFARSLRLEEAHSRALQRLHMAVTRDLLCDRERDCLSSC